METIADLCRSATEQVLAGSFDVAGIICVNPWRAFVLSTLPTSTLTRPLLALALIRRRSPRPYEKRPFERGSELSPSASKSQPHSWWWWATSTMLHRRVSVHSCFQEGLERLNHHSIPVFVTHGNHDPLDSVSASLPPPPNTYVFGPEVETREVRRDGHPLALLTGISHPQKNESRNLARMFSASSSQAGPGLFRLALLHCNVGAETGHDAYAPRVDRSNERRL